VVEISGRGSVVIADTGQCDHTAADHECTFVVVPNAPLRLTALGTADTAFDKWTSAACAEQDDTCDLTPTLSTTYVNAKFRNDD